MRTTATAIHPEQVTIRAGYPDDRRAVLTLAQLDSATVPTEPVLIAEVGGEPRAALSVSDGSVVADPFFPTEHLVALLRLHAAQLAARERRAPARRRFVRAALASAPAFLRAS